jgi:hypothetical protein
MLQAALAMSLPWEVVGLEKMNGMPSSVLVEENGVPEHGVGNGKPWEIIYL